MSWFRRTPGASTRASVILDGPALPTLIKQVDSHCDRQLQVADNYCNAHSLTGAAETRFMMWPGRATKQLAHMFLEHPDSPLRSLRLRDMLGPISGVMAASELTPAVMYQMGRLIPALRASWSRSTVADLYSHSLTALAQFAEKEVRLVEAAIARVGADTERYTKGDLESFPVYWSGAFGTIVAGDVVRKRLNSGAYDKAALDRYANALVTEWSSLQADLSAIFITGFTEMLVAPPEPGELEAATAFFERATQDQTSTIVIHFRDPKEWLATALGRSAVAESEAMEWDAKLDAAVRDLQTHPGPPLLMLAERVRGLLGLSSSASVKMLDAATRWAKFPMEMPREAPATFDCYCGLHFTDSDTSMWSAVGLLHHAAHDAEEAGGAAPP